MEMSTVSNRYGSSAAGMSAAAPKNTDASAAAKKESTEKTGQTETKDMFVKQEEVKDTSYTAPKRLSADQMKAIQEQQMSSFKNMLASMLTKQADKAHAAKYGVTINADLFSKLTVTPEQQQEAKDAISEDGEWGVKAVATRIMDMAMALSGGDSSKIATLRAAVEKGFGQAGAQWGQALPSICQDTLKEIEKRFDYWEEHGSLDGYEYQAEEE